MCGEIVAHNELCHSIYKEVIFLKHFVCVSAAVHKQVVCVTGVLQPDGVSGSREHVRDEHALLQRRVHRCLWSL